MYFYEKNPEEIVDSASPTLKSGIFESFGPWCEEFYQIM